MKEKLKELKEEIMYYISADLENEYIEFKAKFKFETKEEKAEFIRDITSLTNVITLNPPLYSYLIIGAKNSSLLIEKGELNIEESDIRNMLEAYVFPEIQFEFYKFLIEDVNKEIGVFRIKHINEIHLINKDFKDNTKLLISIGSGWTRKGSRKEVLTPKMIKDYNMLVSKSTYKNNQLSELKVTFYNENSFVEDIQGYSLDYTNIKLIKDKIVLLSIIKKEIDEIIIPKEELEEILNTKELSDSLNFKINIPIGFEFKGDKVVFPETNLITELSKNLLNVELNEDFFNLGKLRRSVFSIMGFQGELMGEECEKQKYDKLKEYWDEISQLNGIQNTFNFIKDCYCVPLVLRNIGQKYDEDIRILIKFPQHVTIVVPSMFPELEYFTYQYFNEDLTLLEYLLTIHEDHQVKNIVIPNISNAQIPDTMNLLGFNVPTKDELEEEYYDNLHDIFNFKTYKEGQNQLLEYSFDYLKHNENVAFNSIILVQAEKSFQIEYKITSKHNPEVIIKEIMYRINTNT